MRLLRPRRTHVWPAPVHCTAKAPQLCVRIPRRLARRRALDYHGSCMNPPGRWRMSVKNFQVRAARAKDRAVRTAALKTVRIVCWRLAAYPSRSERRPVAPSEVAAGCASARFGSLMPCFALLSDRSRRPPKGRVWHVAGENPLVCARELSRSKPAGHRAFQFLNRPRAGHASVARSPASRPRAWGSTSALWSPI